MIEWYLLIGTALWVFGDALLQKKGAQTAGMYFLCMVISAVGWPLFVAWTIWSWYNDS